MSVERFSFSSYENTLFPSGQESPSVGQGKDVARSLLLCVTSRANREKREKRRAGYVLNPIAEVRGHRPGAETCQGEMVRLVLVLNHVTLLSSATVDMVVLAWLLSAARVSVVEPSHAEA